MSDFGELFIGLKRLKSSKGARIQAEGKISNPLKTENFKLN